MLKTRRMATGNRKYRAGPGFLLREILHFKKPKSAPASDQVGCIFMFGTTQRRITNHGAKRFS